MEKLHLSAAVALGVLLLAACGDDPETTATPSVPNPEPAPITKKLPIGENIVGEWVADYAIDDPQGYRWEILKFEESGIMYFSNYAETRGVSNSYVDGTYTIGDSTITTKCQLGWGDGSSTQYNTEMRISQIGAYSMTADIVRGGQTLASNTYLKVVGAIALERGDTLPDYGRLLSGLTPRAFHSHNPYVATVDEGGRIHSQWSGTTYVDVTTDQGTAALQVDVNSIFYFDYEDYLGASLKDIVKVFENRTSTEKNVMVYAYNDGYYPSLQRKSGNWEQMRVRLSFGLADVITLYAREDIRFTDYQIEDFLKVRYSVYTTGRGQEDTALDETEKRGNTMYYLGESPENASLGVSWNRDTRALRIFRLSRNKEEMVDFSQFIGLTAADVTAILGEPLYGDNTTWMAYSIASKNVNSVTFRFTNADTNELKTTIQRIDVRLYDSQAVEAVQKVLDEKYELWDEDTVARFYQPEELKIRIILSSYLNVLQFLNKDPNV